jgi:hypothetical protein
MHNSGHKFLCREIHTKPLYRKVPPHSFQTIMPRSKRRKISSGKSLICLGCKTPFAHNKDFKRHFKTSESCRDAHYPCIYCKKEFVGYSLLHLEQHWKNSQSCYNLSKLVDNTRGKLVCNYTSIPDTDPHFNPSTTSSPHPHHHPQSMRGSSFLHTTTDSSGTKHPVIVRFNGDLNHSTTKSGYSSNTVTASRHFTQMSNNRISKENTLCHSGLSAAQDNITTTDLSSHVSKTIHNNQSADTTFESFEEFDPNCDLPDECIEENVINNEMQNQDWSNRTNSSVTQSPFVPSETPVSLMQNDLRELQAAIVDRKKRTCFNGSEESMLDLVHTLKASNAPLILYDRIINWVQRNESSFSNGGVKNLKTRSKFVNHLNNMMYQNGDEMKPRSDTIELSSGRRTNVVTFNFRHMVLRMVTNQALFNSENLLLNPNNIFAPPPESDYYSDVNSGTWWRQAMYNVCTEPDQLLMPFTFFIDGLNIDKYGKITVEAVLACCLWFNRKARNRSSSWWIQGFIEDQTMFCDQEMYVRDEKAQDYHDMMKHIFYEFKSIHDEGGLSLDLNIDGKVTSCRAVPVIQFIIGDCKGNDLLCGRMGGHHLHMKGLCRDCDISPMEGDDTAIGTPLKCNWHTIETIHNKSAEEKADLSFLPIRNAFVELPFGGCLRSIWGATPLEVLHAIELGLCEYVYDCLEMKFTRKSIAFISMTIAGIVRNGKRQSVRNLPDLGPFENGIIGVTSLNAKQKFARIYALYLAFMNPYVIEQLSKAKVKKLPSQQTATQYHTKHSLRYFATVIEDTVLFHQWMKQDNYLKSDFDVPPRGIDSRASHRIKCYLELFKKHVVRGGNGLKTPKFHQMLHITDYIQRFGSPLNFDGGRGENFGKVKIKENARRTNKDRNCINFDIGTRISEEDVIDEASSLFYQNNRRWPSKFCNVKDHVDNSDSNSQDTEEVTHQGFLLSSKHHFEICPGEIDYDTCSEDHPITLPITIKWMRKTPDLNFREDVLNMITKRLFLNTPNFGGRVASMFSVGGYTSFRKDDVLYHAHPCFGSNGPWNDWALFEWEGYTEPTPAQIMMIIDLRNVTIENEPDAPEDTLNEIADTITPMLTKELWVVVKAGNMDSEISDGNDHHFSSKISHRMYLEQNLWMIPLNSLIGPCYVVDVRDYTKNEHSGNERETIMIVEPMSDWPNAFLPAVR